MGSLRHSRAAAWWSARRARVGLDDFLRHRLVRYLAASPVTPDRLPVAISVDAGAVTATPRAALPAAEWLTSYLRTHGAPSLQLDLRVAEAEVARLSADLHEHRQRLAGARHELEQAARGPTIPTVDAGGEEASGRPAVPPPWSAGIYAIAVALVLGAAWQVSLPLLGAAGIAPAEIARELSRRPATVVLPLLFALGASVSLFVFADVALRRAGALADAATGRWRAWWSAAAAGVPLAGAAALAWSIAGQRSPAPHRDGITSFLITLSMPLATSSLLGIARRLSAARAVVLREARAWDHAHHVAVARWTRQSEAVAAEERECAQLEARSAAAAHRLHSLRQRVLDVEQLASVAASAERQDLRRLCHEIASALEIDRYLYLRHARCVPGRPGDPPRAVRDSERALELAG